MNKKLREENEAVRAEKQVQHERQKLMLFLHWCVWVCGCGHLGGFVSVQNTIKGVFSFTGGSENKLEARFIGRWSVMLHDFIMYVCMCVCIGSDEGHAACPAAAAVSDADSQQSGSGDEDAERAAAGHTLSSSADSWTQLFILFP